MLISLQEAWVSWPTCGKCWVSVNRYHRTAFKGTSTLKTFRVQELCESRSGRPGLSVLMSLTVSVDVKQH